ncbi:glycosyltransferase family 2 protein [Roseivirga sp. BDSF3-8]|uniref:glycosyltransferase family 2 protein n=1 Tax=Roseivirga sp. BDSF3-8 TaxID=3241598 RepID=UPI0035326F17
MPHTAIVILNYNTRGFLQKFLPGVLAHSGDCEVIVADNRSPDDSVAFMKEFYPEVRLIETEENLGFASGYNEVLRQVEADYYILLNSDVEVTPDWTAPLLRLMESNPEVAACHPKILAYDDKSLFEYAGGAGGYIDRLGYPFCRGRLFDTLEKDEGQYDDTRRVFWATGACMMVRADIYHTCGGLDDSFFAHMEEIDFCWRIQLSGHKVYYCGESSVHHVGGGTLPKTSARKTYLNFRNGLAMLYKNCLPATIWWVIPCRILLDWVAAARFFLQGKPAFGQAIFRAHRDFVKMRGDLKIKRKNTLKQKPQRVERVIYPGSLLYDYFVKGKKRFSELNFLPENQK